MKNVILLIIVVGSLMGMLALVFEEVSGVPYDSPYLEPVILEVASEDVLRKVIIPDKHVGIVLSKVHSAVNFGNLKSEKPLDCTPIHEQKIQGVPVVSVGCKGYWVVPLFPAEYVIDVEKYEIILVDTSVKTWEFGSEGGDEN